MTAGNAARVIRVYGLWIVLVTAVVIAAAVGISMVSPRTYRSEAIVVVEARIQPNTTPVPPDMGTEKEIAQSGLVVDPAARNLGEDPGRLLGDLVIGVASDANVLTFTVTNADAATAQKYAEALAVAYVSLRNSGETATSTDSGTTATPTQHATLVTDAAFGTPVERPIWITLGLGLGVGLLVGVGTALIRDRMSDRIRGRDDLERVARTTVLATIPRMRPRPGTDGNLPLVLAAPDSAAAESFRYLRSRLQPLLRGGAAVLVTSAGEREGRTLTATNLAVALAQSGTRVVLVDADLRSPHVHLAFGDDNAVGLTSVLAGERTVADVLRETSVNGLRILPAGPAAGNAGDLLTGKRLRRVLESLRGQCDVLVLDSAPVLNASETIAVAEVCDHIVLVADYRRTTRGFVSRALDELSEVVHGNVSCVLINTSPSAGGLNPQGRTAQGEPLPVSNDAAGRAPVVPPVNGRAPAPAPVVGNGPAKPPVSTVYGSARVPTIYSSAAVPPPAGGDGDEVEQQASEPAVPMQRGGDLRKRLTRRG
jgi:capsular exopolysaccharide synthesis family protein